MGARSKDDPCRQPERSPAKGPTGSGRPHFCLQPQPRKSPKEDANTAEPSALWDGPATAVVSFRRHRLSRGAASWPSDTEARPTMNTAPPSHVHLAQSNRLRCVQNTVENRIQHGPRCLGRRPWSSRSPQIFMSSAANGCNWLTPLVAADSRCYLTQLSRPHLCTCRPSPICKAQTTLPEMPGRATTFPMLR